MYANTKGVLMADYLKVSGSGMSKSIQSLNDNIDKIPAAIDYLQDVMEVLSASWEGDAWSAFYLQMGKDIEYLRDVYRYESEFVNTFSDSRLTYKRMEQKVRENVRGISI